MTYFYKDQLLHDKVFTRDVSLGSIKRFKYNNKDHLDFNLSEDNYFSVIRIESPLKVRINNGKLYALDKVLDLTTLLLGDVVRYLNNELGIYSEIASNSLIPVSVYANLPAILLTNACNFTVEVLDTTVSPLNIKKESKVNRTILRSAEDKVIHTDYFDKNGTKLDYTRVGDNVYFVPNPENSFVLTKYSDLYELYADFGLKIILDGKNAGRIISNATIEGS